MDRLERLINLAAELLSAERVLTREELRQRLDAYPADDSAFRRAFERDKEALRSMGMPLVVEKADPADPDSPEGYRIRQEEYALPDPGLDVDELAALHLAVSAVTVTHEGGPGRGADAAAALWKLGGSPRVQDTGEREGDHHAPTAGVALQGSAHLAVLFAAVSQRRPVAFHYRDRRRTLEPWRLAFRNGRWYVVGRDRDLGEERNFRLDRMEAPQFAGRTGEFDRPAEGSVDATPPLPWAMGDEEPVVAHVLVDADQASWARAHVGEAAVTETRADGGVVLELTVRNVDAFRSFVLGFLEHAEVLDPPALRDDIVAWLEGMVA